MPRDIVGDIKTVSSHRPSTLSLVARVNNCGSFKTDAEEQEDDDDDDDDDDVDADEKGIFLSSYYARNYSWICRTKFNTRNTTCICMRSNQGMRTKTR